MKRAVDAADGGGAGARGGDDIAVDHLLPEHFCHRDALRERLYLGNGAEILKEIVAFVDRIKLENCLKQVVNVFVS